MAPSLLRIVNGSLLFGLCSLTTPRFYSPHNIFNVKVPTVFNPVRLLQCEATKPPNYPYDLKLFVGGIGKQNQLLKTLFIDQEGLKLESFGEDAAFVLISSRFTYMGVADGVGGYRESGIDPSIFSYNLMKFCLEATIKMIESGDEKCCQNIIASGYRKLVEADEKIYGGSTICLGRFDKETGVLEVSNLGDSRLMIIMPAKQTVFLTPEQQHYFNCPFQLSNNPEKGERRTIDLPEHSVKYACELSKGDIVLIGTDGFFDNLFKHEVANIVQAQKLSVENFYELYSRLINEALNASKDSVKSTPFSEELFRQRRINSPGGKEDDITLIMGIVS